MAASTVVGQLPVGHGGLGTVHRTTRTILSGEWDRQRWKETGCLSDGSGRKNLYALLSNLVAPMKPADKSYPELKEVLRAHLKQEPLIIVERFRFHRQNQGENETISQYMAELRRLAEQCEFGTYLQEALRDHLVCGLQSEAIQWQLLTEEN